ncbi:GGDEF domain-containing protein [Undibacterium terreum]|uniref:diguanylate cyclase n=1 Tax=Undibacterium terreum TaxID=1224302 RepID=A0A916U7A3_9BURK|nr:GGDEF domain-containing protein [Undibacterium terreum]GGC63262.1 GGDEF domain-containing protein [Undibacterium terreum]
MNSFDLHIVILMAMLMLGAMSIVLYSAHRSFPSEVRGLGFWALGALTMMFASIFFALQGILPTKLVLLIGNALLFWAVGFAMIGTQQFYGRAPSWLLLHAVWLVGMAGIAWWLLARPDLNARIAVFSACISLLYLVQLGLIVFYGERHFSTWFFGALMLVQVTTILARGVAAGAGGNSVNLQELGLFQIIYICVSNFMSLLLTVGFMTVATRRLQVLLEQRSNLDPLTSVLNRRGFALAYAQHRARMQRSLQPMSFMSIDLDHFKSINDRFGHAAGDEVLMHAASTITKALRGSDHLARFGGEEFIVLLPATEKDTAYVIAERIRAAVHHTAPDGLPPYTISIGIACQRIPDETMDAVLVRADAALYRAKTGGRDRIEMADVAA